MRGPPFHWNRPGRRTGRRGGRDQPVVGLEVVGDQPMAHAGLGGDLAQSDGIRQLFAEYPVGGIEDALDVGRLPVGREAGLLEVVLAVVEPAHVEAVRDRPRLAVVRDAALHGIAERVEACLVDDRHGDDLEVRKRRL